MQTCFHLVFTFIILSYYFCLWIRNETITCSQYIFSQFTNKEDKKWKSTAYRVHETPISKLHTLSFIIRVHCRHIWRALSDFIKAKAKQFYLSIMYPFGVYRTKLSQTYLWSNILQSHHALQVMSLPYSMFKWSWNKWQNPSKLETLWHPDLI